MADYHLVPAGEAKTRAQLVNEERASYRQAALRKAVCTEIEHQVSLGKLEASSGGIRLRLPANERSFTQEDVDYLNRFVGGAGYASTLALDTLDPGNITGSVSWESATAEPLTQSEPLLTK